MKLYEAELGYRTSCREDYRPWGVEFFLLEDNDDPVEVINKHYDFISTDWGGYALIGIPKLITGRKHLAADVVNPITEEGKWDE